MISKCALCGGKLKSVKGRKIIFDSDNPGKIVVEADFKECTRCGEKFFDEKQSKVLAKKIDKIIEKGKEVKIPRRAILV